MELVRIHLEILRRMYVHRYIGGRHTDEKNVIKFLPSHERGAGKDALEVLIKQGYILEKIARYGRHVSLNPQRLEEIRRILSDAEKSQ